MVDLVKVRDRSLSVRRQTQDYLQTLRAERAARPRWTPSRSQTARPVQPPASLGGQAIEQAPAVVTPSSAPHDEAPATVTLYLAGQTLAVSVAPPQIAPDAAADIARHVVDRHVVDCHVVDPHVVPAMALDAPPSGEEPSTPATADAAQGSMVETQAESRPTVAAPDPTSEPAGDSSGKRRAPPIRRGPRLSTRLKAEGLATIPGLEAGMIWRLNQVGIATVGDLARADVDTLARKLGPVGRVMNLAELVRLANASVSEARRESRTTRR